jgi:tetratricopeptide (TPR) repeat protein
VNEPEGGGGGWEVPKAEGIALLERGQFEDAVERLRDAAGGDPTGETQALLGLAHFHRERYSLAADCYTKALAADGDQPEWDSMLAACRANAVAEVDVPVPDVVLLERDRLLAYLPTL